VSLISARTEEPIPGYRVVQRIGAGGYGEVWAAQAPGDLRKAIKFVYGQLDEDRAARELKALGRIKGVRHPFLLSLERIEVIDGQLLIVTELADCSLKDRYEECRKTGLPGIPRDELLKHLRDAADALDYMSEQHSLQHLDVKPENLLLLGGRIKVADFGLVKDIHDHTASMMGGLTPVYAPPEVFEGRPSRRSDQYSLAIVYQEMLTGVLPFPGKTAAQLAAQHLNAKPRLGALPDVDQGPVARALSKKPEDRFTRCGELVDALARSSKSSAGQGGPAGAPGQADVRTPDQMLAHADGVARQLAETGLIGQPTQQPAGAALQGATLGRATQMSLTPEEAAQMRFSLVTANAPPLSELTAVPPLVDLPPLAVEMQPPAICPTLFIGIGGSGARVLRRLRRRLDDRIAAKDRDSLTMLLLDSDPKDMSMASGGEELGQLRPEETVLMPLRRSQDYRSDSSKLLEWLSRRWLYNIPRSQQTEGLRPLGRLAMADHAERVFGKLWAAVEAVCSKAMLLNVPPRAIVCGSLCGGTGGGVVADIALALRQKFEDLQAERAEVLAMLAYGTNRNPQQQELAAASGLSTLTELVQFHRPGAVYPGDPGCKLKPRVASAGGLDAAYVVHIGEDLSAEQWEAACDQIAEFLLLDAITPAGPAMRAARQQPSQQTGLKLRSFGLYQLGFAQDRLVDEAVRRVCRETINRWGGNPSKSEPKKAAPRLLPSANQAAASAEPEPMPAAPQVDVEAVAGALAQSAGLDIDALTQRAIQLATAELGGNAETFFNNLMALPGPPGDGPTLTRWLAAASDLFGRPADDVHGAATPGELAQAMDLRLGPWIAEVGAALCKGVEALLDEPSARVLGAKKAAKWLQAHLKGLVERLREMRGRMTQEWAGIERCLDPAQPDRPAKGKLPRRTPAELAALYQQYCRLRMFELSAQRAAQVTHALQSHVGAAHDSLLDLGRELDLLAREFPAEKEAASVASSVSLDVASMREKVAEYLSLAEESLARQIDEQLTKNVFVAKGGLRGAVSEGGEARLALISQLHAASRQAVLAKLQTIDLASLMLAGAAADSPLHKCLADAQPRLQCCGGQRRLFAVIPAPLAEQYDSARLAAQLGPNVFRQLPTIVPDACSDLVLLYELGELSLPHVAAQLCDFRTDLIDAASRLHTRGDVTWAPLVS
jgi:hypothetical protein